MGRGIINRDVCGDVPLRLRTQPYHGPSRGVLERNCVREREKDVLVCFAGTSILLTHISS